MSTLQPLLTYSTLELWVALVLRDLQPLGLAPLGKVLKDIGLPRTAMSAAVRHGLYNSLRVLMVAGTMDGDERASYDTAEFPAGWQSLRIGGEGAQVADECRSVLESIDGLIGQDDLTDELLFRAMAASDSIQSGTALSDLADLAGQALSQPLAARLGPESALLRLLERDDYLLDGMLYFLVEQLRVIPGVGQMIDELERTGREGALERIHARRGDLDQRLENERMSIRRRVWQEKRRCLEDVERRLPFSVEIATLLAHRRKAYFDLFEPVLIELETLFRRASRGSDLHPGEGTRSIRRYALPIEDSSYQDLSLDSALPNDPLLLFHRANKAFRDGLNRKAMRDYELAIQADPTMAEAHFNLAQTRIRLDDLRGALDAYRSALQHDPKLRMLPDQFELLAFTGADGLGLLLKARDERNARVCSIRLLKTSLTTDEKRVSEFIAAIKQLRSVRSKEVVKPLEVHKHKSHLLTVAEHSDGTRLSDLLQAGPLPAPRAARVLEGICSCLARCHEVGIIHGCLRPSCIVLAEGGGVRIHDFNMWPLLAGNTDDAGLPRDHLAPEQTAPHPTMTEASDIYAATAILFEMLTGVRFGRRDEESPSGVIPAAGQIIRRGLAPDPAQRCTLKDLAGTVWTLATAESKSVVSAAVPLATLESDSQVDAAEELAPEEVRRLVAGRSTRKIPLPTQPEDGTPGSERS